MGESLPFDEVIFGKNIKTECFLKTPADSDIGYFVEVDLKYPDELRERTKISPFRAEKKLVLRINLVNI